MVQREPYDQVSRYRTAEITPRNLIERVAVNGQPEVLKVVVTRFDAPSPSAVTDALNVLSIRVISVW